MNVAAHQKKEKNVRRRAREGHERRENSRPISKRLRAALRSFRGVARHKMVCVRGVPEVSETLGKANSHFDPTQTGSGTASTR